MSKFIKAASLEFDCHLAEIPTVPRKDVVFQYLQKCLENSGPHELDLIVICENFAAHGLDNDSAEELADPGPFLQAYQVFAAERQCFVAGSIKLRENGRIFNSLVFIDSGGSILGAYHKVNLTQLEIDQGLSSGKQAVVFDTKIGRLGGIICFDLNFEEIRQEYVALKPDILTFSSMYHGGLMQQTWAYECRSFFISSLPRMGCGILDPFGQTVAQTHCYSKQAIATINIDRAMVHLAYNQEKFPKIRRKYQDEVLIDIPANIGPAIIYSQTDKRSAMDIVKEFELELLDDYFDRMIEANKRNRD